MIADILVYIIKCIYGILPGVFAVMTPIFVKNYFKKLAIPVDLNKKFKGKPIFGKNKTYRGLIFGVGASIIVAYLQLFLHQFSFFQKLSFVNYNEMSIFLFGFLMGFGALFGDLVESFIKRQLDIAPGRSFMPWDQIDAVIGGFIFILLVYKPSLLMVVTILLISFFLHLLTRTIGYALKITKDRW